MKGRKVGTPKTGGREPGTPNKVTTDLRERIKSFLDSNIISLQTDFDKLEAKDKLKFIVDLLPYIVPKPQTVKMDFIREDDKIILSIAKVNMGEDTPTFIFNSHGVEPVKE